MSLDKLVFNPITIVLIFICCLYFLFDKENDALQIHSQLESLKIEIEIDISNEEYLTASKKLKNLVHPSSDYSTIKHFDSGFWDNGYYRYNDYWSNQRLILLNKIMDAKKNKDLGTFH